MTTNRQRLIEKLLELANHMKEVRRIQPKSTVTLAQLIEYDGDSQGMPENVYDSAFDVLGDVESIKVYAWLQGAAEMNGFDGVAEMLRAADIGDELLGKIHRLEIEAPDPRTAPEHPAARAYKAILESIQNQIRERLARMDAVIIRSADAPIIDELARTAAHSVVAELEV